MQAHAQRTMPSLRPPLVADAYLLSLVIALLGFSLVMIYSTTGILASERFGDDLFFVKRQASAALLGLAVLAACIRLPILRLQSLALWCLPAALLLLGLTLIPGLGDSAGGAKRWINLGFLRFQPGELVKLLLVLYMASFLARHEQKLASFQWGLLRPMFITGLIGSLYLMQPDFGSTVVCTTVLLLMGMACGVRLRYLALGVLFIALCFALLIYVSPYRMQRVLAFLSPMEDSSGRGYQLIQSLIAVGTGQVHGVGLGASQQKLFFLPAAHTDFIFAVIAEELGFLGAVALLLVFSLLLWRGVRIASRVADNTFLFALATGLTLLLVLPAMLNVGVVTGLLPTKGMVLPLVGYGGSSLIVSLAAVGLLLGVARATYER
jgi:cell division protein FtsW